jgi:hypothetical protein
MRDLGTIDSELRLLAAVRRTAAELGGPLPSIGLLDERACPWRSSKLRQRERGNRLRLFGSNKHQRVINPLVQQLRINVGKHLGRRDEFYRPTDSGDDGRHHSPNGG